MNEGAEKFWNRYGRIEYAIKRAGMLIRKDRQANADWKAVAQLLGADFFTAMTNIAPTLIKEPPGELQNNNQVPVWAKRPPLQDTEELFTKGVCKVRANLMHYEKFIGSEEQRARDEILIREADAALAAAEETLPQLSTTMRPRH